eukprot:6918201-Pyramimonas_sp.AAC.1
MDMPDVTNIRECEMHAARAVAGSSPEIREAHGSYGPSVANEQRRNLGRFQRLDIMFATNLIEKFNKHALGP